ncbi:MAG: VWA domain-containing protein [Candidatus Latescibacterota bacterium]|jgi:Ca-activated chloride channel family protein
MHFGYLASFWLLLLLPLLGVFLVWAMAVRRRVLARFADPAMVTRLTRNLSPGRRYLKAALLWTGVLFLVLALTGPRFGARTVVTEQRGVDLVVALDVSRSMLAEDVKPSRLARARDQIGDLLDRLEDDRVGLVLFAGQAFVQCPLTTDHGAVRLFLDLADVTAVPSQGTAIGDAIRVATRCFDPEDREHRVLVLFSDGEDHVGNPVEAARAAAAEGVRILTVGLGTPTGELIPEPGPNGAEYHKDRRGNYVKTRMDERTLEEVARVADGVYYRSTLAGRELDELRDQVSGMGQRSRGTTRFTQYEERFQVPLLIALLCFLAEAFLPDGATRRGEWRGRFS